MASRPVVPRLVSQDEAERIAISGLAFLAGDPEILSRFLALSGVDLGHLRAAAAEPGFLGGVLAFIAGDEKCLLAFAESSGHAPEAVAGAFHRLNPELPADS
jgi:hypothetical protein